MASKSLDTLRLETRRRATSRAAGAALERWTLGEALRRRARRKRRESMISMLVFGGAMAATIGVAGALGLV